MEDILLSPNFTTCIPAWLIAVFYAISCLCILDIVKMPILVRASLTIPLALLSIFYAIIWVTTVTPNVESLLISIGNLSLTVAIISNYIVYRYARRKKIL